MDLQRASSWKRIAAWVLDLMLLAVLTVGVAFGLSAALGYDSYDQQLEAAYDRYEQEYGIVFDIDQATYEAMTETERENYDTAYDALIKDTDAMYAYNMLINLSLVIITLSVLVAYLVLEFAVPLLLKNGQTVGKKCFSLGAVRIDSVKATPVQMFTRTVLGKFAVETMIPVYVLLMLFWGTMGLGGTVALLLLVIIQIVCIAIGQNRLTIHDRLAGTVVVDISSQKIFENTEALIAYTKRIHAEQVKRQNS